MLGMCDVQDLGCLGYGMFEMWYVGIGRFDEMWDVDLQNTQFEILGYSGYGMWELGYLTGCGILIYKIPSSSTTTCFFKFL